MYARECRSKGKGRGTGCVDMPRSAGCRDGRRGARLYLALGAFSVCISKSPVKRCKSSQPKEMGKWTPAHSRNKSSGQCLSLDSERDLKKTGYGLGLGPVNLHSLISALTHYAPGGGKQWLGPRSWRGCLSRFMVSLQRTRSLEVSFNAQQTSQPCPVL